jgi:ABC-2 type transport system permease protein
MLNHFRQFLLLVRVRVRSLWNVARYAASRHRLLAFGLTLLGIATFTGIYYGFRLFLALVTTRSGVEEMVYEIFYFLLLFLLAGAVPFVASTLLHATDYLLLGSAPVPPGVIVAAKLLDATVTNSLQFTVIGIPAIAACGVAMGMPPSGWPFLALVVALFVLLPALLTALLLMIALALFGMRRVRRAITAVNTIMATVVCLTIVAQANRLPLGRGLRAMLSTAMPEPSLPAQNGPSGWFARALIRAANGDVAGGLADLAQIALLVLLLYVLCMALGEHLLSAAAVAEEGEGEAAVIAGEMRAHRRGLLVFFSSPVAALITKDMKYILRDSMLLSQLAMPGILFFVPFMLAMQESFRSLTSPVELYPFAEAMTGVIVFMQTSILSLSSIGLESRSFWLVLSSPNGGRTLLWAKFVMSTLVSGGIGVLLTILAAITFSANWITVAALCAVVGLSAAALCGMGVGISAALPRFVYENPAHRVSAWALILGFLATMLYLALSGSLFITVYLIAGQAPEYALPVWTIGAGLFLLLTAATALIPMAIGARRIEVYQWEY